MEVYTVRCSLAPQRCQQIIVSGYEKVKFSAVTIALQRAFVFRSDLPELPVLQVPVKLRHLLLPRTAH